MTKFETPSPKRTDLDLLNFLLNTGFSVSSGCQEEFYFVTPLTNYYRTARQAAEAAMEIFESRQGYRWREPWTPTRGI